MCSVVYCAVLRISLLIIFLINCFEEHCHNFPESYVTSFFCLSANQLIDCFSIYWVHANLKVTSFTAFTLQFAQFYYEICHNNLKLKVSPHHHQLTWQLFPQLNDELFGQFNVGNSHWNFVMSTNCLFCPTNTPPK